MFLDDDNQPSTLDYLAQRVYRHKRFFFPAQTKDGIPVTIRFYPRPPHFDRERQAQYYDVGDGEYLMVVWPERDRNPAFHRLEFLLPGDTAVQDIIAEVAQHELMDYEYSPFLC